MPRVRLLLPSVFLQNLGDVFLVLFEPRCACDVDGESFGDGDLVSGDPEMVKRYGVSQLVVDVVYPADLIFPMPAVLALDHIGQFDRAKAVRAAQGGIYIAHDALLPRMMASRASTKCAHVSIASDLDRWSGRALNALSIEE